MATSSPAGPASASGPSGSSRAHIIRGYRPGDRDALYEICVRTGLAGADATGHYRDPEILPVLFAEPYAVADPALAFVADDGRRAIGYVVATADSTAFFAWLRASWLPRVAGRFSAPAGPPRDPDEQMRDLLHHAERMLIPEIAARFPAHLHIDLLPEGQGRGLGTRLMEAVLDALRERGVPGVHLGMNPANTRARAFYDRLGFTPLADPSGDGGAVFLGLRL